MKIAVVGSGIAGLAATWELTDPARGGADEAGRTLGRSAAEGRRGSIETTLFEAAPQVGGHVLTIDAPSGVPVDMGFIVHNRDRYPLFCALLAELGIPTRATSMAFSVSAGGVEWGSSSLSAMFADRRLLASARHWRFLVDVVRFLRAGRAALGRLGDQSLDDYLAAARVSPAVREQFVVPLAAALWSLAPDRCGAFPAETYFRFLDQHGMLRARGPLPWRTIVGGSRAYVGALLARLHARPGFTLRLGTPVESIRRDATGAELRAGGATHRFDRVVIATHADTALALLADPSADERAVLGAFRYSRNRTVLHTDRSFLPRAPRAHAAWNYVADPDTARVAVTYSMTILQGLPERDGAPYLVTLNPRREPRGILHEAWLDHPQFDRAALAAQRALPALGHARHTAYAGAHFGFGFHEDGMRAGLAAARAVRSRP